MRKIVFAVAAAGAALTLAACSEKAEEATTEEAMAPDAEAVAEEATVEAPAEEATAEAPAEEATAEAPAAEAPAAE